MSLRPAAWLTMAWMAMTWAGPASAQAPAGAASDSIIALVGGTVIDGNGGPPQPDTTVVIVGNKIAAIGPSATTKVPSGAWRIDVRGKYLTPGLIDANVHVTFAAEPLDAVQEYLRYGVTTIRDTHGALGSLLAIRDSLQTGHVLGARLLVAGSIIGMGHDEDGEISRQTAYDLRDNADSLRTLTSHYLDKGLDFIKIAVTDHDSTNPQPSIFSRRALETMIAEAHRRGKHVDSHTNTPEGLELAVLAGVDVLQHPEALRGEGSEPLPLPDSIAQLLAARHVICAIFPAMRIGDDPDRTQARENAQSLIRNGCIIAIATDGNSPETTLQAIETAVDFGMTPAQALTAATRTGAIAAGAEREYGTLEVGKYADVLVLDADPLADIHHIERLAVVIHNGRAIDPKGNAVDHMGTKGCLMRAGC